MRRFLPVLPVLLATALLVVVPTSAVASADEAEEVHDILFPVAGDVHYSDTFGAPRGSGRSHEGQDLLGEKMQELVAADSGTITFLTWPEASYGYYVRLTADDGWVYSYVHINNDTPGTDDDAAEREDVYGPGIEEGARVERGQLIGYLGDSGNAESTAPHLHFEMHDPDGALVNPMASLDAAQHVDASVDAVDAEDDDGEASPIARLAGVDRVATAIAVAQRGWPDGADAVVLASGASYAEALPASVLAARTDAPMLLVGDELTDALVDELEALDPSRVTVTGSVPSAVDDALDDLGYRVRRVGAAGDAESNAAGLAAEIGGDAGVAVLVNESRFADGVSAAGIAAAHGWPILLTTTNVVPQVTVHAWRDLGVERLVLVGGTGVIGANIESWAAANGRCAGSDGCGVERVAGTDRYATSVATVERSIEAGGTSVASVLLGTGTTYPDALASGPLAARLGGVALLVDGSGRKADRVSRAFLAEHADDVDDVAILGGRAAVTSAADRAIQEALGLD
jgi:putative cell wall-binding protein